MPEQLYIVEQRRDAIEVVEWRGSKTESWNYHGTTAVPLTQAFRRARMMAGERPGLTLEEVPVVSQVPLVFLGTERG